MSKTLRAMKKLAFYGLIAATLAAGAVAVTLHFFSERVVALCVAELNRHLAAPVAVGKIELAFWRTFPKCAVSFQDVAISSALSSHPDSVFCKAQSIDLTFSLADLYRGDYHVKGLRIRHASVLLVTDHLGRANYNIFKPDTAAGSNGLQLELQNITLDHVHLRYDHRLRDEYAEGTVQRGRLSGNFSASRFEVAAKADMFTDIYRSGSITWLKDKHMDLDARLLTDLDAGRYELKPSRVDIEKSAFTVEGVVLEQEKSIQVDMAVKSAQTDIRSLLALLPGSTTKGLDGYRSEGQVWFSATAKGFLTATANPLVTVGFGLKNATVENKKYKIAVKGLHLKGTYTNGSKCNNSTSVLSLGNMSGMLEGRAFTANLKLANFDHPYLDAAFQGEADLAALHRFYPLPYVQQIAGNIKADMVLKGRTADFADPNKMAHVVIEGKAEVAEVDLRLTVLPHPLQGLSAKLWLERNALKMDEAKSRYASSAIAGKAFCGNFMAWLFEDATLDLRAQLEADKVELAEWAAPGTEESATPLLYWPKDLRMALALKMGELKTDRMSLKQVNSHARLRHDRFEVEWEPLLAFGGSVSGMWTATSLGNGTWQLQGDGMVKSVDLKAVFRTFDNFGQDNITAAHLSGSLNMPQYTLNFVADSNLNIQTKTLAANLSVMVKNGALTDYEPVVSIGRYLKRTNFRNLAFSTLYNDLSIRNETIYIGEMHVASNVADLYVSGSQTFDFKLDYKIKVNVTHLLTGKRGETSTEFGVVQVDDKGGTWLHLTMSGTTDNPVIRHDAKAMATDVKKSIRNEGQQLKNLFSGTPAPTGSAEEGTAQQTKNSGSQSLNRPQYDFIIGWDDEPEKPAGNTPQKTQQTQEPDSSKPPTKFQQLKKKVLESGN